MVKDARHIGGNDQPWLVGESAVVESKLLFFTFCCIAGPADFLIERLLYRSFSRRLHSRQHSLPLPQAHPTLPQSWP